MNQLATISDAELDKAIDKCKERSLALRTDSGRKFLVGEMRQLIAYLESVGYKTDADMTALSRLWARGLAEEYVMLGLDGMKRAIVHWVETDTNEYGTFPKIPWIKAACAEVGGDPRVEKGRREQARLEAQIEADTKAELEKFYKDHPALKERVDKIIAEKERSNTHDSNILGSII